MYAVLSYLPTVLHPSKPSLAQYVQENIFEPLGMNSTTYSFQRANATNRLADAFGREGDPTTNPLLPGGSHAMPFWLQVGDNLKGGSNCALFYSLLFLAPSKCSLSRIWSRRRHQQHQRYCGYIFPRSLIILMQLHRPSGFKC
jgi:hypothetical protein